jgi:hypothetical protein
LNHDIFELNFKFCLNTHNIHNIDSLRVDPVKPAKQHISENDVPLQHLPDEYRSKYLQLLNQFSDILSLNVNEVGNATVITQRITLKDPNKIASTPPYRLPVHLKEVALEYVRTLLDAGIIRKSTSPFCSPLLLVKKPNAKPDAPLVSQYRVCHDFRRLNALQVRDSYPLHNLYELLDNVAKAKLWTVIDLSNGFFNQNLEEQSKNSLPLVSRVLATGNTIVLPKAFVTAPLLFNDFLITLFRGSTKLMSMLTTASYVPIPTTKCWNE